MLTKCGDLKPLSKKNELGPQPMADNANIHLAKSAEDVDASLDGKE